ncbi:hypothetical protein scyTo_0005136 [Scyliorhinus torazame]|uniref:Uncharacterized protein n=1 Tax=Scyliorhinus torazame TaxID=75743 RepID=A0A401P2U1_SCYTO|nr:hypothetical protein [Scyliorhinus torazame]
MGYHLRIWLLTPVTSLANDAEESHIIIKAFFEQDTDLRRMRLRSGVAYLYVQQERLEWRWSSVRLHKIEFQEEKLQITWHLRTWWRRVEVWRKRSIMWTVWLQLYVCLPENPILT